MLFISSGLGFFLVGTLLHISNEAKETDFALETGGSTRIPVISQKGFGQQMHQTPHQSNPKVTPVSSDVDDGENNVTFRALKRAIQWTKKQMGHDWGWGPDTPHTVLALSIADARWFATDRLEAQLISRQFELLLLLRIFKHREPPLTTGQLALNVMALVSLCKDPRTFYEKDLVALLDHREGRVDFEIVFSCLASCTAGRRIKKSRIRRILEIISDKSKIRSVDTLSISILSLHCAEKQRRRGLRGYVEDALSALFSQQAKDGSFAHNLHSTAIALQAMTVGGFGDTWNATQAQQYLMSHQQEDGSFGNLFDTNAVLPLLAGKSLLDAGQKDCHKNSAEDFEQLDVEATAAYEEENSAPPVQPSEMGPVLQIINSSYYDRDDKEKKMINVTYIIWVGENASMQYNLTFGVPENTTFYDIMNLAAERDEHFEFSASKWANGYYIHTLAGQKERQIGYWFWLLYRLREPPVPGVSPDNKFVVSEGVQELIPDDGDYLLFWYHKI